MRMTELLKRNVSFRSALEAVSCLPGHIADFVHAGTTRFFNGRVRSISGNQIVLDRVISLDAESYAGKSGIWVRTCEDVLLAADVLGPFGQGTNTFYLSAVLEGVNADYPDTIDPWVIGRKTNETRSYRILDINPPGNDLKSEIRAIEYRDDVYYHPDYDAGLVAI